MHYSFVIKRGTEEFHEESSDPITKQQWLAAIRNNSNFEFDIGLERSDYDYAELLDEDDSWLHFEDTGTLTAEYTTPLFLYHILCLATDLNAIVIGEEGEVYELSEQGFKSRLAYQNGNRINHWLRIEAEDSLEFRSEVGDEVS